MSFSAGPERERPRLFGGYGFQVCSERRLRALKMQLQYFNTFTAAANLVKDHQALYSPLFLPLMCSPPAAWVINEELRRTHQERVSHLCWLSRRNESQVLAARRGCRLPG